MKERPILFSAPMVRALLDGSKTQTRRVVKASSCGYARDADTCDLLSKALDADDMTHAVCPYGQPGDQLWVREAFAYRDSLGRELQDRRTIAYSAAQDWQYTDTKWKPSIHMPRWASRITLEITGARVERLQEISEGDALAEGVKPLQDAGAVFAPAKSAYCDLWESINGLGAWFSNPWVWVVEFKRITA